MIAIQKVNLWDLIRIVVQCCVEVTNNWSLAVMEPNFPSRAVDAKDLCSLRVTQRQCRWAYLIKQRDSADSMVFWVQNPFEMMQIPTIQLKAFYSVNCLQVCCGVLDGEGQ